jgi:hypothetical protein
MTPEKQEMVVMVLPQQLQEQLLFLLVAAAEVLNLLVELLVDLAVLAEEVPVVMEPQEPQEPLILVVAVELLERHLPQVELVVLE